MSINNSREFIAMWVDAGWTLADHLLRGRNIELPAGAYTGADVVTFQGTAKADALLGGGGELFDFFLGTRGDDLYGPNDSFGYVDYSAAETGVRVDLTYVGSRSFTDADGEIRTVDILGRASDGFGGTDHFADSPYFQGLGMYGIFGSSHRDVMIADPDGLYGHEFYGGAGNDLLIGGAFQYGGAGNDRLVDGWESRGEDGNDVLIGGWAHFGGAGNDRLVGRVDGDGYSADGEAGNDRVLGSRFIDWLVGGEGDDCVRAGDGNDGAGGNGLVTGNAGDDHVDGGAGDDFIDGGVGADVLLSGAGDDVINPDVEYFQLDPEQARDGARDVIRVTRADVGDFDDVVLSRSFEEGLDQVRFRDAAAGRDFRVYHEDQSFDAATGRLFRPDDLAGRTNTVLQIDADGDGFGRGAPDAEDYFLFVLDADLSLRGGWLLT